MKIVKVISMVCVLALTLVSGFAFAATQEAKVEVTEASEGTRSSTEYVVVKLGTYLYNSPSTSSGYVFSGNIPIGNSVYRVDSSNYYDYSDNRKLFYKVSYGSYTGYVIANHIEKKY